MYFLSREKKNLLFPLYCLFNRDPYYNGLLESLYEWVVKSPKYLVSRCLEPRKAFSGDVWVFKHLLTRYLED